jgi:hypothetical protein
MFALRCPHGVWVARDTRGLWGTRGLAGAAERCHGVVFCFRFTIILHSLSCLRHTNDEAALLARDQTTPTIFIHHWKQFEITILGRPPHSDTAMADNGSEPPTSTSAPEAAQAALSCHLCRRRKIKCDRILPSCLICIKNSQTCVYPEGPLKPGPKLGASRRQSKRTRSRSRSRSKSRSSRARRCSCANATCPADDKRGHSPVREGPASQGNNSLLDNASRRTPTDADPPAEQPPAEQPPAPATLSLGPDVSGDMNLPTLSWIIHPTPEAARALDIAYAHPDMAQTYRAVGELTSIEQACCDALHTSLADTYHL